MVKSSMKGAISKMFKKSSELSKMSDAFLHNRFVLYLIFFIAIGNIFHFAFTNDLMSVGVFIAAGVLTSFFSKNMIVIMVVSMVVTHIIRLGQGKEGFLDAKNQEKFSKAIDDAFNIAFDEQERIHPSDPYAKESFQDEDDEGDEDDDEDLEAMLEEELLDEDDDDEDEDDDDDEEGFRVMKEGFKKKKEKKGKKGKKGKKKK